MKLLYRVALLLAAAASMACAQGSLLTPATPLVVNSDYTRFRYDDKTGYIEVSYAVYPGLLTLQRLPEGWKGAVELRLFFYADKTDSIAAIDRALIPVLLPDTSFEHLHNTFVGKTAYALPFGPYRLKLLAIDTLNRQRRDSLQYNLTIVPFDKKPSLSDPELCSNITQSQDAQSPFYKNTMNVVPNPGLVYGTTTSPMVFVYSELYQLDTNLVYSLRTAVVDGKGVIVKEKSKRRKFSVPNAAEPTTLNIATVPSGKFRLVVSLFDTLGTVLVSNEKPVFIHNPNVKQEQVSSVTAKGAELAGMTYEELGEEFRRAKYIATDQDISTFDKLTTVDGRREFLAGFWVRCEQGTGGRTPMTRADYMMRIATANSRYNVMGKEGWATDRGRVYMLNGEPDEFERFPNTGDNKPYEKWHYYSIENGVEFVFVDRSGFGDYILVHSTKRGELRDDDWERYLK